MVTAAEAARLPPPRGAIRVARVFGIDVHVHWAWLLVAAVMIEARSGTYSGILWNATEYLALFGIVLLHEFGHALACKSVGGRAEHILLWPLGGVAYVRPPQRPGPTLWVSAAGPLVNVVLLPITLTASFLAQGIVPDTDLANFALAIAVINGIVLVFNLLPVFPLDGGQILRSLAWFFMGPHRSLTLAAVVGLIGAGGLLVLGVAIEDWWLLLIALFALMSSWGGFRVARARAHASTLPRRTTHACPSCGQAPPLGPCWPCVACRHAFDAFADAATCPRCQFTAPAVPCPFCGDAFPVAAFEPLGTAPAQGAATIGVTGYGVR